MTGARRAGGRLAGVGRGRLALAAGLVLLAHPAQGQSLLERSPNVGGGWVGAPGVLHFNFLHRFTNADPPTRKVTSSPTFLVAAGLPWRTLVGFNYATNSDVAARYPNEWEAFGRVMPLAQDAGSPVDVGLQAGYNVAARSTDAELSLGRRLGPLQLRGAARVLSNAHELGDARAVIAGGGVLRIGRWIGIAGDYGSMLERPEGFDAAWSGALHLAIPYSPHTLSLHVTNTSTATLHGASAARGDERRYGFEFTIPLTLRRYLPRRGTPAPVAVDTGGAPPPAAAPRDTVVTEAAPVTPPVDTTAAPPPRRDSVPLVPPARDSAAAPVARDTARPAARAPERRPAPRRVQAGMRQLAFTPARIEIVAGTTVVWTNRDAMVHTVTGDAGGWDSGLIEPGRTWSRRFDRPGTYPFHCAPHPFMKGVVVVRAAEP